MPAIVRPITLQVLVSVAGITACFNQSDCCAPLGFALVYGRLQEGASAAVLGAAVTAYGTAISTQCHPTERLLNDATSTSDGRYRLAIADVAATDSECVWVGVRPAPGTGLRDTLVGPLRLRLTLDQPVDSTEVNIVLSP